MIKKKTKKTPLGLILISLIIILGLGVVSYIYLNKKTATNKLNNEIKEQTAQVPGAVLDDLIKLNSPLPQAEITSPLIITGQARGSWFFEGSFPVILTDWDGKIIAQTTAQALTDWLTDDYVTFKAELKFQQATKVSKRGYLILKKDNPSGLPEKDKALEVPIFFKD